LPAEFLLSGDFDEEHPDTVDEATVRNAVLEGSINYAGHVKDIPGLLAKTNIVVVPSYHEGLPSILLEAGASQCALVGSDIPGCREVIEHNSTGLLVGVGDPISLAKAVWSLVEDTELRSRLAASAQALVHQEFTIERVYAAYLGMYGRLGLVSGVG
jgi:glycosyltransferase involved in cell wall biosynthesis